MTSSPNPILNRRLWHALLALVAAMILPYGVCAADAQTLAKALVNAPPAVAADDVRIREAIHRLQGDEREAGEALEYLQARPRSAVISDLREDLQGSSLVPPGTFKCIVALQVHELLPVLKGLAERGEDPVIFITITRLVGLPDDDEQYDEFVPLFQARLKNLLSPVAKIAVLDGLSRFAVGVSHDQFLELTRAENLDVRIAVVENFVATASSLQSKEALFRWQEVFRLKPYQARLTAMEHFERLPKSERVRFAAAFHAEQCAAETEPTVKTVCQRIALSLRAANRGRRVKPAHESGKDGAGS